MLFLECRKGGIRGGLEAEQWGLLRQMALHKGVPWYTGLH